MFTELYFDLVLKLKWNPWGRTHEPTWKFEKNCGGDVTVILFIEIFWFYKWRNENVLEKKCI